MTDTKVLTIGALDYGIDRVFNYMKRVCRGFAVQPGHEQIQVKYPARLDSSAGDNPSGSIAQGAWALQSLLARNPGPKIVLGYSQGAQVVGTWMRLYSMLDRAPHPVDLSFILIGNPERRLGQQPWTRKTTPEGTQYQVRDVARRGDNWADWHGDITDSRILAMFGRIHTNYWNTDIFDPLSKTIDVIGNTEYVVVP